MKKTQHKNPEYELECYQVGGAIRDSLLNSLDPRISVSEKDWVVVGSSVREMLALGFKQVGKNFPVFLHPNTGEEYALARLEQKQAQGYHGFTFDTSKTVTLEEDLSRRDLTINAIACDPNKPKHWIDPYGGLQDIKHRQLRHISHAFIEDPLRVLRVARFYARFAYLGFRVAPSTLQLMQAICVSGELRSLSPERVWQETQKALLTRSPQLFFQLLYQIGGLNDWFPEIEALFGVPQPARWHPEIDCGLHSLLVLEQATKYSSDLAIRYCALTHDLGKGTTPKHILPSHHGHEERGVHLIRKLSERLRIAKKISQLAMLSARWHTHFHRHQTLRAQTYLKVLMAIDYFRQPMNLSNLLIVSESDSKGRTGFQYHPYPAKYFWHKIAQQITEFEKNKPYNNEYFQRLNHKQKKQTIERQRLSIIQQALKEEEKTNPILDA